MTVQADPTSVRVLQPGLMIMAPGTERYRITGGGATVLALGAGDELEITDPEGRQRCEISAFAVDGRCDPGLLGASGPYVEAAARTILSADLTDARRVRVGMDVAGLDVTTAVAASVFDPDEAAGATVRIIAQEDVTCVVAAPGGPMEPHEQNPPTDLIVHVHRVSRPEKGEILLPHPLADPEQDFRIDRGTATTYQVKAGDYFQVLDIEGRECSDFQCFDAAALERSEELALDATITRSLMGAAYPGPGLFSKFYDARMNPMVEVVQDTVGRHDTFNLACTAKYYEEMGYPGHINCTDNINGAVGPFGVAERVGWQAINFFYNTNLDDANQIFLDEPWSRPGDYVLLRALEDLVCVSTACPCDIDAANGWEPTDIQIRVYPASNIFKKATAFRMTADSEAELTRETGFHPRTSELTRNFGEYNGFWLADSFTQHGAVHEYWACREAAAVIDLSPLRKYEVVGPDAELLMQTCVTRDVRKMTDGQVVYTAMCYDTGGMIDDGTVFRLGRENFRWIGGRDISGLWLRRQAQERGLRVWVRDSTDQLHNLQVQGPHSRAIVDDVVWTRPDQPTVLELGWFRFAIGRIGDHLGIPIVVSRTGFTGELGYEIFCHPKDGPAVWDAIWTAGEERDLSPMGLEALDVLRIEAGLMAAGAEFDDQIDPFEAGIGFTVALKASEEDFISRAALVERKANPQRRLVGLELTGGEPGVSGDGVFVGRAQVGEITSGTISPTLRKNIALCRIAIQHSTIGVELEVGKLDGHQKRIPATVVRFPFYDPDKTRVRS